MTDDDLDQIESNARAGWYPYLRLDVLAMVAEVRRLRQQVDRLKAEQHQQANDIESVTRKAKGSLWQEINRLRQQIEGHCARIAEQSELLSKRAEREPCPVALARLADDGCPHGEG